jgi:hypothetical protein
MLLLRKKKLRLEYELEYRTTVLSKCHELIFSALFGVVN